MTAYRATWRRLIPAVFLSALAGVVAWADVGEHAPKVPVVVEGGHPTGHLHDHSEQTWPPQPRGIRNVVPLGKPGDAERSRAIRERRVARFERIALARPDVRQALGNRYTRPDLVAADDKGVVDADSAQLFYFSHENNTTVEVTIDESRVRGIRRIAATDYQPDVTDDEIEQAEAIARTYFSDRGAARVSALAGYGILAYQPEGKGFFPVRVIYISFHEHRDAPPEFSAWVDLSNQQVLRAREERS